MNPASTATRQWICAPCAILFDAPPSGGFSLGEEQPAACPQCQRPAQAAEGGLTCPQADDSPVRTRYSLGPQLFAGVFSGAILAILFIGSQLAAAWLLRWGAESWIHTAVTVGNGLWCALWAFVNISGLMKPG